MRCDYLRNSINPNIFSLDQLRWQWQSFLWLDEVECIFLKKGFYTLRYTLFLLNYCCYQEKATLLTIWSLVWKWHSDPKSLQLWLRWILLTYSWVNNSISIKHSSPIHLIRVSCIGLAHNYSVLVHTSIWLWSCLWSVWETHQVICFKEAVFLHFNRNLNTCWCEHISIDTDMHTENHSRGILQH